MINHEAIYALNSSVVTIRGDVAYDADGNEVHYDKEEAEAYSKSQNYIAQRRAEYPPITDYLDAVVKGDQDQIDAYIAACLAVKNKYPKSGI